MLRRVPTWPLAGLLVGLKLRLQMLCYGSLASRAEQGWMFFRWPWDGATTLLGPSGRPLATSPAVQGAARDDGGGGSTSQKWRAGGARPGNGHRARLARYMARAARWLQHTAPATTPGRSRRSGLRWRRPGGRGHAARRATGSGTRRWGVAPRESAASPHGGAERNRPPAPPPPFRSTRPPE